MDWLRAAIRRFDDWLSRCEGVEPFTDDSRVILRIQVGRAARDLILPQNALPAGTKVLLLHLWNERMPPIPEQGPDLAYGLTFQRAIITSLKALARHIQTTPALQDVQAVGGVTAHILLEKDGGASLLKGMGFTLFPYHRPAGAFGEFWENFYTWWLMWTFNPVSTRQRSLTHLQRSEFWMTAKDFLKRYGKT